jgi:two-component system, cell cycle response regulator DivK
MRKRADDRCRVLIVNGFDGRQMYASYLEYEGLVVCEVTGPRGALKAIRRFRPDVLVTDYVFPGTTIDAPAFIEHVRNHAGQAQPAIVVVSGYTRPEDERRARTAGADDFVLKPCLPDDLLSHIMQSVEMRRRTTHCH